MKIVFDCCLASFEGMLVSLLFCFFNSEVRSTLKREMSKRSRSITSLDRRRSSTGRMDDLKSAYSLSNLLRSSSNHRIPTLADPDSTSTMPDGTQGSSHPSNSARRVSYGGHSVISSSNLYDISQRTKWQRVKIRILHFLAGTPESRRVQRGQHDQRGNYTGGHQNGAQGTDQSLGNWQVNNKRRESRSGNYSENSRLLIIGSSERLPRRSSMVPRTMNSPLTLVDEQTNGTAGQTHHRDSSFNHFGQTTNFGVQNSNIVQNVGNSSPIMSGRSRLGSRLGPGLTQLVGQSINSAPNRLRTGI